MQSQSPKPVAWRSPSLRGRVVLLAGTVVALLTATLLILVWVLRTSQTNLVRQSNKHLEAVAHSMADAYVDRPDKTVSLAQADAVPPLPPVGPPPVPPPPPIAPAPPRPTHPSPEMERSLRAVTAAVLRAETGIEGGYYQPANRRLVGYDFPTHEGPGNADALPARETPDITDLAASAVNQNKLVQDQYNGPHDVILFTAIPVCDSKSCDGGPVGAAWLMQRIPGAETERKRVLLWSVFGFGGVACITVVLAFLVLTQVDRGTQAVLDRLTRMESDLSHEAHPEAVNLAEFHRLFDGLDRLSETLRTQIERERELQSRLRQNERLAAIGQLAAGVAHELRNPLATIRLRSQMAQRRTMDESVAQANAIILSEVDRLDGIIERLLNFSRPIRINQAVTDISSLCRSVANRWISRHPSVQIDCNAPGNIQIETDASRLEQVLDNVIENAVHQISESHIASPHVTLTANKNRPLSALK